MADLRISKISGSITLQTSEGPITVPFDAASTTPSPKGIGEAVALKIQKKLEDIQLGGFAAAMESDLEKAEAKATSLATEVENLRAQLKAKPAPRKQRGR